MTQKGLLYSLIARGDVVLCEHRYSSTWGRHACGLISSTSYDNLWQLDAVQDNEHSCYPMMNNELTHCLFFINGLLASDCFGIIGPVEFRSLSRF